MSKKGNTTDRPFEIGSGQDCGNTSTESKMNDTSIYLDLRKSNFSSTVQVSVIGCHENGESLNCTNKGDFYYVESGKKYMLYNQVKELNFNFVYLKFTKSNPQEIVSGVWSADSIADSSCQILRSGNKSENNNTNSAKGNFKDEEFQIELQPGQTKSTNWRPKYNTSSIYLNLTGSSFNESINVSIYGRNSSNSEKNCTNRVESFTVYSRKKYFLYNKILEEKCTETQLRFVANNHVTIKGKWSPDSIIESGCITITGKEDNFDGFSVEQANKADHLINVPYISQVGIPAGCEGVSATMVLNYYGCEISANEFINSFLERKDWSSGFAPDPDEAFIGNPFIASGKNCGYGCYAPCIVKAMNKVFNKNGKINVKAIVIKGNSLDSLCSEYVKKGTPVLIWATMNMIPSSTNRSPTWTLNYGPRKGQQFTWIAGEHCLVFVGSNKSSFFFNDPYKSNGVIGFPRNVTEQRYKELGMQAVVFRSPTIYERFDVSQVGKAFDEKDRKIALDFAQSFLSSIGLSVKASVDQEVPFANQMIHGTVGLKIIHQASLNSSGFCIASFENNKLKFNGKAPFIADSEIKFTKNSIALKALGHEIKIDNLPLFDFGSKFDQIGMSIGNGKIDFSITKDGYFQFCINSNKDVEYGSKLKEIVSFNLSIKFQFNPPPALGAVKIPQLSVDKVASSLSSVPPWVFAIAGTLIFVLLICMIFAPEAAAVAGGIGVALSQVSALLQPIIA